MLLVFLDSLRTTNYKLAVARSAQNYINGKGLVNVYLASNPVVNVHDVSNIIKRENY